MTIDVSVITATWRRPQLLALCLSQFRQRGASVMKLDHVLLPCKMASQRIPRQNLRTVGGRMLLDLAIDRFQAWFPETMIWVATEDTDAAEIASRRRCVIYPLTPDDIADRRNGSELFNAWLAERESKSRCMLYQVTSPFVFRSELLRAINDRRDFCCSAWLGTLHFALDPTLWFPLSQNLRNIPVVTGNFGVSYGRHVITPEEVSTCHSAVSWLSAIDINTPDDLRLADRIARRMTLQDFNDVPRKASAA